MQSTIGVPHTTAPVGTALRNTAPPSFHRAPSSPVPVSDAVRSSIRRFLSVSDPDRTNMIDVYRHLQRELGEAEVTSNKLAIRNATKAMLDEMAAAAFGRTKSSPLAPIVLPTARIAIPHPVLPARGIESSPIKRPQPVWAAAHYDELPALEAVPTLIPPPSATSLPAAPVLVTARVSDAPPTLPLAHGHAHNRTQATRAGAEAERRQGAADSVHNSAGMEVEAVDARSEEREAEQSEEQEGSEERSESERESERDASEDEHNSGAEADEAEDDETEDQRRERKRSSILRTASRSKKKRKPNKPLAVDEATGEETWEVRKIHRSDVDCDGHRVYKVSWWNWTVWPRHTWIRRDEWMGSEQKLDDFEAEERAQQERAQKRTANRHGRKRGRSTGKKHEHDITAQTSWAFDEALVREVNEKLRLKEQRERESGRAKKQAQKAQAKKKAVAAKKSSQQKVKVKKEEDAEEVVDEEVDEEARVEAMRAEAQKRRDKRRRLQEEEDKRVNPFVRAHSRYLIPWSSDDEAEHENKAVEQVQQRRANGLSSVQQRRERRRALKLHEMSLLLHPESDGKARSASQHNDVQADGGMSDATSGGDEEDRERREEAGVSVHESELTSAGSEAEMEAWRAERVYRVDAILDHRRAGQLGRRQHHERRAQQAERKRRADEKAAAAAKAGQRLNAFERARQRLEVGLLDCEERKEAQPETADEAADTHDDRDAGINGAVSDERDEEEEGGGGRLEYWVQWSGQGEKARSWEPEAHLAHGCKALLREYKLKEGLVKGQQPANGISGAKKRKRGRRW